MDSTAEAVLISIHPEYVDLIFSNIKKIEFRKSNISKKINKFIVYSTAPVSQIVGYFESSFIEKLPPIDLWNEYSEIGGIKKDDFFRYYANREIGIGIHIDNYYKFKNPISLNELNLTPPQSYQYINQKQFSNIIELSNG